MRSELKGELIDMPFSLTIILMIRVSSIKLRSTLKSASVTALYELQPRQVTPNLRGWVGDDERVVDLEL